MDTSQILKLQTLKGAEWLESFSNNTNIFSGIFHHNGIRIWSLLEDGCSKNSLNNVVHVEYFS